MSVVAVGSESGSRRASSKRSLKRSVAARPSRLAEVPLHVAMLAGADCSEADAGTRTPDPLLTMEVLYQLSYVGASDES